MAEVETEVKPYAPVRLYLPGSQVLGVTAKLASWTQDWILELAHLLAPEGALPGHWLRL